MDGYLTKPLNQKVLSEALHKYCMPPSTTTQPEKTNLSTSTIAAGNQLPPLTPVVVTESLAVADSS